VVREIFDEYTSAGRSIRAISRRLYEDGVTSPTGREVWASSMLSGMLRNRTYMGAAEWFRHETIAPPAPGRTHGRQTLRPKEDWIRVAVPAIITEEMFEAAQRVKRDNSIFSPRRTTPGAWTLLLSQGDGDEFLVEAAGEVALECAHGFAGGLAFALAALEVGACWLVVACADAGDRVQRVVRLAVASA
jgi:hypothetical protein